MQCTLLSAYNRPNMAENRFYIEDAAKHVGQTVTVRGWVYNKRSSGKIKFLVLSDGTGLIQGVLFKGECTDEAFEEFEKLTQESSVEVTGALRANPRGGYEMGVQSFKLVSLAEPYPIYAQGPRRRVPDGEPPSVASQPEAMGRHPRAPRDHAVDQRVFRQAGLHPLRRPDPHAERVRGHLHAFRHQLFRREGVSHAVRPALRRSGRDGVRQDLRLRPDVPGREIQDPQTSYRVLDGRARRSLTTISTTTWSWREVHRAHRSDACSPTGRPSSRSSSAT